MTMDLAWIFTGGVAIALLICVVWRWASIGQTPGFEEFEHILHVEPERLGRPSAEMDVVARDGPMKAKAPDREKATGSPRLQLPPHQHA